jgi:hypothetical protein
MAPSIRPCCDLSEHWSRSLLGPKEPGRVSAARRRSWEGSQENRSRQATRRDPESRNDRRQLRSRRVRFQSRRWTGLRLPCRCTRSRCLTTEPLAVCRANRLGGRAPPLSRLSAAHRAVDAGLGGLSHQLSLELARRHTPPPSGGPRSNARTAAELAQHRCRIGRGSITVRPRSKRVLQEVAIPLRRQEFAASRPAFEPCPPRGRHFNSSRASQAAGDNRTRRLRAADYPHRRGR